MSRQHRTSGRWLLPGIILGIACAGWAILRLGPNGSRTPTGTFHGAASQMASPETGTNRPLINSTVASQSEAEAPEDRVVALISEGNQRLALGDYAEAAHKFEQAVAISPGEEDLHYNLAIALARLGKTEEAKKHYEEALRIFPDFGDAHNNLGNLLMTENKLEEAIGRFREAIKALPEIASFHNNLGTAFGRQGKVAEAIGEFTEAIERNPAYVEARVNLANAFLATGRVEEAIAQLDEALRLKPDFKPALQTMQRARQRRESNTAEK